MKPNGASGQQMLSGSPAAVACHRVDGPHSPPNTSSAGLEFPVIMRQNVAAGKTPVGTKVQAKLVVATLVDGVVVPQDARRTLHFGKAS